MFCLNHRSIKVTLFSEIHIKIISKISLTYHQIAFCGHSTYCLWDNFDTLILTSSLKRNHLQNEGTDKNFINSLVLINCLFLDNILKIFNRPRNVSIQCSSHHLHDLVIIFLHPLIDPVKHNSHKAILIEICNK